MHSNWYETFFRGPAVTFWHRMVPPEHTAAEIEWLLAELNLPPGARILDVPCGSGRHAVPLAQRGFRMTGVDLSSDALALAQQTAAAAGVEIELLHGNMAELAIAGCFPAVLCLGNSFGYLEHQDNERFLMRVAEHLEPGGRLLIGTGIAAESLLPNLKRQFQVDFEGRSMAISNEYDAATSRLLTQYTFIEPGQSTTAHGWHAIYTCAEIGRMLSRAGLRVHKLCGAASGKPYELGDPWLLVIAEKP